MTVQRRTQSLSSDVNEQLQIAAAKFKYFPVVADASTAQLLLFVRGISENFEVTEKCVEMNSTITTDGAPAMIGIQSGMVSLLRNHLDDRCKDLLGQFKEILEHTDAPHSELKYYSEVWWISLVKVLKRFADLIDEVIPFLEEKVNQNVKRFNIQFAQPSVSSDQKYQQMLQDTNETGMWHVDSNLTTIRKMKKPTISEVCSWVKKLGNGGKKKAII
ncbi:uncharacterized protein LOC118200174 [Stegodyphus dumicola]|uniref:uncharacterized protein LOC118200174 n=1 Tax=Stegodyphus dumicola TaxID=202533 RepID=UPI0015AF6BC9|nr:uncharacterized protein LOC118200174 [Stegodyphus dumicola]